MSFDEWWKKESEWGGEHLAEYHLAKAAWNKAVRLSAEYVRGVEGTDYGLIYEFSADLVKRELK